MSAQVTSNLAGIDKLLGQLQKLTPAGVKALNGQLAEEGIVLVHEQFDRQGDPQGNPWLPRNEAFSAHSGQILRNTRRFESSFVPNVKADGFEIGSNFIGARVLTQGATITPKRAKFLAVPTHAGGFVNGLRKSTGTAFLKQVTIPGRAVLPSGEAGPIWGPRLVDVIKDFLAEVGS